MHTLSQHQIHHLHEAALRRAACLRRDAIRAAWATLARWLHVGG